MFKIKFSFNRFEQSGFKNIPHGYASPNVIRRQQLNKTSRLVAAALAKKKKQQQEGGWIINLLIFIIHIIYFYLYNFYFFFQRNKTRFKSAGYKSNLLINRFNQIEEEEGCFE